MHPTVEYLRKLEPTLKPGDSISATYLHPSMACAALPVWKLEDGQQNFSRVYPGLRCSLSMTSKPYTDPDTAEVIQFRLPYGPLPRMFIAYFAAYARETGSADIPVGKNVKKWLGEIGISSGAMMKEAKQQLLALSRTMFYMDFLFDAPDGTTKTKNEDRPIIESSIFDRSDFFAYRDGDNKGIKWPEMIRLHPNAARAFNSDVMAAVPFECMKRVSSSATSMDLLGYLVTRMTTIPEGEQEHFSYTDMSAMFGEKFYAKNPGTYRKNVQTAIRNALSEVRDPDKIITAGRDAAGRDGLWLKHADPSHFKYVVSADGTLSSGFLDKPRMEEPTLFS